MTYTPPLRDMHFVLNELLDLESLLALDRFSHVDVDDVAGLLAEAGRFNAEVIAPLNRVGDEIGSRVDEDGQVTTPPGFADAYAAYCEAGWPGIQFDPDYGGGGLPWLVGLANQELTVSASMAFSLCPMLTQGAIEALTVHGSEEQKDRYLEAMITGRWSGTMNLTEPEAGSDVGALRTRATPNDDGSWSIAGTKIFITWGEHDMAENIIHLVLARTPDAPPGTKGISLFIVPKFLVDDDGSLAGRNDVRCVSLEHKLGINASPTAVLAFGEAGGAIGYLIGEEHRGMQYMFTMMNNARLTVGLEGLAVAERSYQMAAEYARTRKQGRAVGAEPGTSSPIVDHPDVRRMLMTMRAGIEAMRGLLYLNALAIDHAAALDDEEARRAADERMALLTPLSKGWCTDLGVELTSLAIQVYGGMGYVEETGVAQHWRDSRIAPIYEGTNGIQAIDLVMRKLPMREGGVVGDLLADMAATNLQLTEAGLDHLGAAFGDALTAARDATAWLLAADVNDRLAGATPYLELLGTLTGGWMMARSALVADVQLRSGTADKDWYEQKLATAAFFLTQRLPRAIGLVPSITAGVAPLVAIDAEAF